jgi:two-component system sensor histidine kinase MprB
VRSVTVSGKHYRLVTVGAGTYGALQHARDLADVDNTLSDLLLLLVITAAGGVVAAAAVGVLVTRSSLRPVRKVSDAAAEVARTQNLSALIPEVGPEEIAEIARSVNSMLVALETSRARQRELIDDTSHELRTPLTSLRTNIDVLLRLEGNANADLVLPPEERAQLLADVRSQMVELGDLVSQLVQLARAEAEPEPEVDVDVQAVVTRAVERARLRAPRATIRVSCAPALLLRGRPSMLERAVVNLLDNAVKFGPPDGTVTVAAVPGSITVADEGPGIAEGERARVFDRFYRSPRARALPGSGLGLAIVAEAAREHGGSTAVETAPAGGALIRVRLPGLADGAAADEPASASPQPARA